MKIALKVLGIFLVQLFAGAVISITFTQLGADRYLVGFFAGMGTLLTGIHLYTKRL